MLYHNLLDCGVCEIQSVRLRRIARKLTVYGTKSNCSHLTLWGSTDTRAFTYYCY